MATKTNKDFVETYFDYGVDILNRRVFLDRDVDGESASAAIRGLYLMEIESKAKPIEIFVSTFGGCVYETLGICDIMGTIKCPIHTFAYSKCMSAGLNIVAAGKRGQRWVAPNCSFMHHDINDEFGGTRSHIRANYQHLERLNDRRLALLGQHTKQDASWWKRQAGKPNDIFFDADSAIEWGLADHIWVEK